MHRGLGLTARAFHPSPWSKPSVRKTHTKPNIHRHLLLQQSARKSILDNLSIRQYHIVSSTQLRRVLRHTHDVGRVGTELICAFGRLRDDFGEPFALRLRSRNEFVDDDTIDSARISRGADAHVRNDVYGSNCVSLARRLRAKSGDDLPSSAREFIRGL